MAPPSLPKKLKVRLPENEELAGKLLEKHHSMMTEQTGALSEHQGLALAAAYRGLCASKQPIRSPADLLRTKYAMLSTSFL
jgi:crossover junction endonuclease MUS81